MRRTRPLAERFWSKVDVRGEADCWRWTAATKENGYGTFGLGRAEGHRYAHRFAWELTNGPIPDGLHVCHHCDHPPCCNPSHLFLGTAADNAADKVAKGRSLYGERHNLAQLTEVQVLAIREAWANGERQAVIAERFGTNKANVSQIVRGKKWKHLLPDGWEPPERGKWSRAA